MPAALRSDPCDDGERICETAFDWTGSSTAADVADVLIGKPLAIAGLVLLAVVLRWVLHRTIDRVAVKAETRSAAPGQRPDAGKLLRRKGRDDRVGDLATDAPTGYRTRTTRRVQRAKAIAA